MEPEKAERLRQYIMGKSEISAGDQLVLLIFAARRVSVSALRWEYPFLWLGLVELYAIMRRRSCKKS